METPVTSTIEAKKILWPLFFAICAVSSEAVSLSPKQRPPYKGRNPPCGSNLETALPTGSTGLSTVDQHGSAQQFLVMDPDLNCGGVNCSRSKAGCA
jgi:hypothetical protein